MGAEKFIFTLDEWVNLKIHLVYSPLLTKLMVAITSIANPLPLAIISFIFLCALIYKKKWRNALLLVFSLGAGVLFGSLIRYIIQRARPANALIEVDGYSFPSRHAIISIIFFLLLLYSFKNEIKNKFLKNLFIAVNIILFLIIGFSRVYLNVHWLSDVIAGFAMGLFSLTLFILIFRLPESTAKR